MNNSILSLFNESFNIHSYTNLMKECFKDNINYIDYDFNTEVPRIRIVANKEHGYCVRNYSILFDFTDNMEHKIAIATVCLTDKDKLERNNRVVQRDFVNEYIMSLGYDAAIIAFYNEQSDIDTSWRVSFVEKDYINGKEVLTHVKRSSYLVGPTESVHTCMEQFSKFLACSSASLPFIEEIFSVEKVTNEFFKEYRENYFVLRNYIIQSYNKGDTATIDLFNLSKIPTVEEFATIFSKKLMGQLVFLYFIQKKGWLGVESIPRVLSKNQIYNFKYSCQEEKNMISSIYTYNEIDENYSLSYQNLNKYIQSDTYGEREDFNKVDAVIQFFKDQGLGKYWGDGDKEFISTIFKAAISKNRNFYKSYLEPLFYDALNNNKRYKSKYFKYFGCDIPFLNGGLFQVPFENYYWKSNPFNIPNEIFGSIEGNKIVGGILGFLNRYSFTIKEDEPLETEVAVDPEMLGKIFEQLLEVSDRKSKGTVYTPREVVQYMCRESIVAYLDTHIQDASIDDIREFVTFAENYYVKDKSLRKLPKSISDNCIEIDNLLANIKVCDIACGSGAFNLGMLNEIVRLRNSLYLYLFAKKNIASYQKNSPEKRAFEQERKLYSLKRHAIKNSIFGVDIEKSAVDIAKLRMWLSLVVDYDDKNYIMPLPNLDYTIMSGNSLIEEIDGAKIFDLDKSMMESKNIDSIKSYLEDKYNYFDSKKYKEKIQLKSNINKHRTILVNPINNKEKLDYVNGNNNNCFSWDLEFLDVIINGGFDIIIGNPPYVGEKGNKHIFQPIAQTEFGKRFYQGKMDLLYFFFHKGIDLLKDNGILSFITTNYFVTANGAKNLRADLKKRTSILKMINFGEIKIFENAQGQHNLISIIKKQSDNKPKASITINNSLSNGVYADSKILQDIFANKSEYVNYFECTQNDLYEGDENYIRFIPKSEFKSDDIRFSTRNSSVQSLEEDIFYKILDNSSCLGGTDGICNINTGIQSGADKVSKRHCDVFKRNSFQEGSGIFILDENNPIDKSVLNSFSDEEKTFLKPFYKNSDISKYLTNTATNKKIIYSSREFTIDDSFSNIEKHLLTYKNILSLRREVQKNTIQYYHLQFPRTKQIFQYEKIVAPQRSKLNTFGYSNGDWYASADVYFITEPQEDFEIKYILALLNSKLYYFWLYNKGKRKGNSLELYQTPLSQVPIKKMQPSKQIKYVELINNILDNKDNADIVSNYSKKIDELIYIDYGLTKEEIEFAENFYHEKTGL